MKAANFEYHAPERIDEVVALLHAHGDDAKLLAGGQSLVPILALRLSRFGHLIDLNRVTELVGVTSSESSVVIGAMTRQSAAERDERVGASLPLVARAIPHIGHFQIRNRGTIGGSISHADPASELPACAVTLDAQIEVAGPAGRRMVPASQFFLSIWETALEPDEVTVAIHFPARGPRSGFAIEELAWRLGDFAVAGALASVQLDASGRIERAATAFMGMGATPVRASAAESELVGRNPAELDLDELGRIAAAQTDPSSDVHASADYRRRVAASLFSSAVRSALEEAAHV